jgi:tetratricopeptide (TPR) repeat protein
MRLGVLACLLLSAALAWADPPRNAAYERVRSESELNLLLDQCAKFQKEHRYDQALKAADHAVSLAPKNPLALNAKGAVLTQMRRFEEARKIFDEAIAIDPDGLPPQFNEAEIFSMEKKYAEAAIAFHALTARFGSVPVLKFKVYLCYALAGEGDHAAEALAQINYPADGPAWYFAQAASQLLSHNNAEGRRLITTGSAIYPDEGDEYLESLHDSGLLK